MKPVGVFRRLGAWLYDALFILCIAFLVLYALIAFGHAWAATVAGTRIVFALVLAGYWWLFGVFYPQSAGMRIFRLHVRGMDGNLPTMRARWVRWACVVAAICSLTAPIVMLFGVWATPWRNGTDRLSRTQLLVGPRAT